MIYVDEEYYNRLIKEQMEENNPTYQLPELEDFFGLDEDDEYFNDSALEAYCTAREEFIGNFVPKALKLTIEYYPQFRSKKEELKETLAKESRNIFEGMHELSTCDINPWMDVDINNQPDEFSIDDINNFVRNTSLDYLLEDYHEWFKRKTSFEYIYVESYYASVYIKSMYKLLVDLLYNHFPGTAFLPSDQLAELIAELKNRAWAVYDRIARVDPDEINKSSVLLNLEDYEFENLLNFRPKITRNEKGKIVRITIPRNMPNPAKMPLCCLQCKNFNNTGETNILCAVTRFNQPVSGSFSCRAWISAVDGKDGEETRSEVERR